MTVSEIDLYQTFKERAYGMNEGGMIKQCIQCGRCAASCPFGLGMDFTPRKMVAALRAGEFGNLLEGHGVWTCTACYHCTSRCPAGIPITDVLIPALRETVLLHGHGAPVEFRNALQKVMRYGNPFGESPRKRVAWTQEAGVPVPILQKTKKPVEVLLIPECYGAYHQRGKHIAIAIARILHRLGVNFGIIGPAEKCIGDSRRLAGEFGLFELLVRHNAAQFDKYQFKLIVTLDPHSYNAIKNEYPLFGHTYPVMHYTRFLADHLDDLKPLLTKRLDYTVAYHDPCYLGRRNEEYQAPRSLIRALPGVKMVELPRNRGNSLCCGGGGGGVWLDSYIKQYVDDGRPSEKRLKEMVRRTKANVLVTACPLCLTMFEDASKLLGLEDAVKVVDVGELVIEAMES